MQRPAAAGFPRLAPQNPKSTRRIGFGQGVPPGKRPPRSLWFRRWQSIGARRAPRRNEASATSGVRVMPQHRGKVGRRRAWYAGGAGASEKSQIDCADLFVAECANVLWKKVQRCELLKDEALLAARLFQHDEIELLPVRYLLETATRISIEINHSAYDCVCLALAAGNNCEFVTADQPFARKLHHRRHLIGQRAILLREAVKS
jgi:predicted nucleic acid-binding protein